MGLLYTPFKIFHYREKVDSLPRETDEIRAPLHIRIKPTNVCNHNCWYCAYRAKDLQLGQDMQVRDQIPPQKMREIVADIVDMGVKAVTFSGGGEPFCYPHLLETVGTLAEHGVQFAALTNGALVSGEIAELFARKASWLRVSMDGWDDESYREYRGAADGEFSRIMSNLEDFQRYGGDCYLGVSYIIDRKNVEHIYAMARRLKDVGVNSIKLSGCIVSNDGAENNRYHKPVFGRVREEIARVQADLSDARFEVFDAYHELDTRFDKAYRWCPYQQILPIIGADLNVYSCQDKAYNLACGNLGAISERSFRSFWFSDKNRFFTIDPSRDCSHHCVANRKNLMLHEYFDADPDHLGFV